MFGEIGWEVTLNSVMESLGDYKGQELTINISGPGGYVDEAFGIYSFLNQWKKDNQAKITFNIIGTCASCDSFIPMVGDEIVVNSGSRMMIHLASAFAGGNAEELRKLADDLESYSNQIADIYLKSNKKGKTLEEIKDWMSKETYFNAQELIDFGFATKFEDVRPTAKLRQHITNTNTNTQFTMANIVETIRNEFKKLMGVKNEVVNMAGTLEDGTTITITPVDESLGVPVVGDSVSPALPEMKVVTIGEKKYDIQSDEAGLITSVSEVVENTNETMDAAEVQEMINKLNEKHEADLAALKNELETLKNSKVEELAAKDAEIANLKQANVPPIDGKKKPENNQAAKPKSVKEKVLNALDQVKQ
jgi:ATP-dependent Clp protease protease subunit